MVAVSGQNSAVVSFDSPSRKLEECGCKNASHTEHYLCRCFTFEKVNVINRVSVTHHS
jgi:hypothetical protein